MPPVVAEAVGNVVNSILLDRALVKDVLDGNPGYEFINGYSLVRSSRDISLLLSMQTQILQMKLEDEFPNLLTGEALTHDDAGVIAAGLMQRAVTMATRTLWVKREARRRNMSTDQILDELRAESIKTLSREAGESIDEFRYSARREMMDAGFYYPDELTGRGIKRGPMGNDRLSVALDGQAVRALMASALSGDKNKQRILSQFEANRSNGAYDLGSRGAQEVSMFGYHPRMEPSKRPIYAFASYGGIGEDIQEAGAHYGDFVFVLKTDVNDRATVTETDSLSLMATSSPMNSPGVDMMRLADRIDFQGDTVDLTYAEAQIHSTDKITGVRLEDVAYILVRGQAQYETHPSIPEADEIEEALGIPVVHLDTALEFDTNTVDNGLVYIDESRIIGGERISSGAVTERVNAANITATEAASLSERSEELKAMDGSSRAKIFTADNGDRYVIHMGAANLEGGVLDPMRSRGVAQSESSATVGISGNTRALNEQSMLAEKARLEARRNQDLDFIELREELLAGRVNLDKPLRGGYARRRAPDGSTARMETLAQMGIYPLDKRFQNDNGVTIETGQDGERFMVIPDSLMNREGLEQEIDGARRSLNGTKQKLGLLEELKKYNYQHISAYPVEELNFDAFHGYGGRYDDGTPTSQYDSFQGSVRKSNFGGIHIVRVTPGKDVITTAAGDERGIIGPHTPIATLIIDRSNQAEMDKASKIFAGWVESVIKKDKGREPSGATASESSDRLSSGSVEIGDYDEVAIRVAEGDEEFTLVSDGGRIYGQRQTLSSGFWNREDVQPREDIPLVRDDWNTNERRHWVGETPQEPIARKYIDRGRKQFIVEADGYGHISLYTSKGVQIGSLWVDRGKEFVLMGALMRVVG